jgi:hypothetical protein
MEPIKLETFAFGRGYGPTKIEFGKYADGPTAIEIREDRDGGQRIAIASVNIDPDSEDLPPHQCFVKGWSENEGLPEYLEELGIIRLEDVTVKTGFVDAQLATIVSLEPEEVREAREVLKDQEEDDPDLDEAPELED